MHCQFEVDREIKQTNTNTQVHKFGRPPWPCGGKINKEIEESRHKWGSTLLSLTIHFPITKGDTGAQWSTSIFPLAHNGSGHQQQYSFTFRLSHSNKDAGRHWPPKRNSLSYWKKWKINRLSPVDSFQFHFRPNLISYTHQACLWNQILRKMLKIDGKYWSKQENVSVRGRRAVAWQRSPLQIMAWHLESEPVKCQTGYDRNGDRQIMTDLWPRSSERSQLTQPSVSWCAFRSRKGNQAKQEYKESLPTSTFQSRFLWGSIHGNSPLSPAPWVVAGAISSRFTPPNS